MNHSTMPRFLSPLAALLLVACGQSAPAEPPPLAGAAIGAPFTLTGEDGKPVRWDDFAGRYRVVYFGYTFCPDVCPTDLQRTAQGLRLFDKARPELARDVVVLFVTVDPQRDTPAVLREFTDAFDPRIVGLTGTPDQIAKVAGDFAVASGRGETSSAGGYLVDHSNVTYLFDRAGKPLATLPTEQGPQAVAAELEKWVR